MENSNSLLLRFKSKDTLNTVSRKTLELMAHTLKRDEIQVVQLALAKLRNSTLPVYSPDDGPVSIKMIRHIRKNEAQGDYRPTRSLLKQL